MNPLFNRYQGHFEILFWLGLAVFNTITNSLSVLSDHQRRGLAVEQWQPWLWEASSQGAIILLIPLIIYAINCCPPSLARPKTSLLYLWLFSIGFSISHVIVMVMLRKAGYWMADLNYSFGHWPTELLYEYRKDLGSYLSIVATIYTYRFIISRLRNEAAPIAEGEDQHPPQYVQRFIVKKLGKEFTVRAADIEWVEAAGNYMNLHVAQRCYPLRETMSGLAGRLDPTQFCRIHRSYLINLDQIGEIVPQPTGDFKMTLKNGQTLNMSRRYRDALKAVFS